MKRIAHVRRAARAAAGRSDGPRAGAGARIRSGDRRHASEAKSRRLAGVAAHAGRLGLQPARSDQSQQRLAGQDGVDPPIGSRAIRGHTSRPRRRHVCAERGRLYLRGRREDRRHSVGVQAQAAGRRESKEDPDPCDLGQPDHQLELGQLHLRAERADRAAGVGNARSRSPETCADDRRTDHRQRQGHHRPPVPARRRPRLVHRHRARRQNGKGGVALPHHSRTGRAELRIVGRCADGTAVARRNLDGAELRS